MTMSSKVILDIETDGLEPTVIWVVVTKDVDTGKVNSFLDKDEFKNYLSTSMEIIGHNIIGYDVPALEKLWGVDFTDIKLTDTLIMSRLANPQRLGGHALKNWGSAVGFEKGDYHDWCNLNDRMIAYCKNAITYKLFSSIFKIYIKGDKLVEFYNYEFWF